MVQSGRYLLGQYQGKVTVKGRLSLPKKLRLKLGKTIIVTRGYDGCLLVMGENYWQQLINDLAKAPFVLEASRETNRFLLGNAAAITLDRQGRFILPQYLRQYAGIKKQVVFLGLYRYLEIWDYQRWQRYQRYLGKNIKHISEKLMASKNGS